MPPRTGSSHSCGRGWGIWERSKRSCAGLVRAHCSIERCANALHADSPAFTRRNLFHAVCRAARRRVPESAFDRALHEREIEGPVVGLLPDRCAWDPRRLPREWDAYFPSAILLVDRRPILDLFVASGALAQHRLAVVALDGTPAPVVSWLKRGFGRGRKAAIAYLHDAATVVYPFGFEPLATLAKLRRGPLAFRDLGLPPLGRAAGAFATASLPPEETILELEALPPSAVVGYAARETLRMMPMSGPA